MALSPYPLYTHCTGVNNRFDPVRRDPGYERERRGVTDLQQAEGVVISDSMAIERSDGFTEKVVLISGHSLYCNGYDCIVAQGTAIYDVGVDYSLTQMATGLSGGKLSYAQVGSAIYYAGAGLGIIDNGVRYSWDVDTYIDTESKRYFEEDIPQFSHIAFFNGQIVGLKDNALYISEAGFPGLFDASRAWLFGDDCIGVMPVDAGLFVSTVKETIFLRGSTYENFSESTVANYPMYEWSEITGGVLLGDLGLEGDKLAAVWNSPEGLCAGLPDGRFVNLIDSKIIYPSNGTYAATTRRGKHVISVLDSAYSTDTNLNVGQIGEKATVQRSGLTFNSFAHFNGAVIGCTSSGLFSLGGSTNDEADIDASFTTWASDFGHLGEKKFRSLFLEGTFYGDLLLTPIVDGTSYGPYTITPTNTGVKTEIRRKIGRGIRGYSASFKIENVDGSDFVIDKISGLAQRVSRAKGY